MAMDGASSVPIEKAVAIPTFIGSLMSFLATSTAIVFHIMYPPTRHFRHALIINLLVADFINSLNNTISGGIYLGWGRTGNPDMPASPSCIANGWIGQLSVQTVDFTILIISISVLSIVLAKSPMGQPSLRATIATCAAAWIPGLITSNVALGYNVYGHVSGNWCWILPDPRFRYGLTHGWRIAIFIATIGIYTAIYIHLKRVFDKIRISNPSSSLTSGTRDRDNKIGHYNNNNNNGDNNNNHHEGGSSGVGRRWRISAPVPQENFHTGGINGEPPASIPLRTTTTNVKFSMEDSASTHPMVGDSNGQTSDEESTFAQPTPPLPRATHGNTTTVTAGEGAEAGGGGAGAGGRGHKRTTSAAAKMPAPPNLKRMLLMNGYPIAYIILWIPGMANRLVEVINGSSPVWLRALQASTQFVGLANAVTYGLNEQARGRAAAWRKKKRPGAV